jgi:hypothetical protein
MDGRRYALLVSNSEYEDKGLRTLRAPSFDAAALSGVLRSPTIGMFELTAFSNRKSDFIQQKIEKFFSDRELEDTLLLYFSGHGIKDDAGNLYLAARNTTATLLRSTGISDSFIRDVMKGCRARRQVLILDCCFGGAFARGLLAKGEADRVGVNELFQGQGRVILTASTAMEFALEEQKVKGKPQLSTFTKTLVNGLKSGEADIDGDGRISVQDLYNYAYKRIALPGSQQTPTISSVGQEGEIILAIVSEAVRTRNTPQSFPAVGVPVRAFDLRPWVTIRDQGNEAANPAVAAVTALETFLSVHGGTERLSPRYVYQKAKQLDGQKEDADIGINIETLVRVLQDFGCPPEDAWPYVPGEWRMPKNATWETLDEQARRYRAQLIPVRAVDDIQWHLRKGQPLLALFAVYESTWYGTETTQRGFVTKPTDQRKSNLFGALAVTIVDYDQEHKTIHFAHTWGKTWGNGGFGEMTLDTAQAILQGDQMWAVDMGSGGSFVWSDSGGFAPPPSEANNPAPMVPPAPPHPDTVEKRARKARSRGASRSPQFDVASPVRERPKRAIYDARHKQDSWSDAKLPAKSLARGEGRPPTGDAAVDQTYDALGVFFMFFSDVFKRNSWDGKGAPLEAVVHFGRDYENAFWDGRRVIMGDAGKIFKSFHRVDIVAKECAMGLVQSETGLVYEGQSGALLQSLGLVFASMVKQYALNQTAARADWLIGDGMIEGGKALMSLEQPGSAYKNEALGADRQVDHMSRYTKVEFDNGGVHINCGIPNRAFVLVARDLGGKSWDRAGRIWYDVVCSGELAPNATFGQFAQRTISTADKKYGSPTANAIRSAWSNVGVKTIAP